MSHDGMVEEEEDEQLMAVVTITKKRHVEADIRAFTSVCTLLGTRVGRGGNPIARCLRSGAGGIKSRPSSTRSTHGMMDRHQQHSI